MKIWRCFKEGGLLNFEEISMNGSLLHWMHDLYHIASNEILHFIVLATLLMNKLEEVKINT